jgi:hypothetical protein
MTNRIKWLLNCSKNCTEEMFNKIKKDFREFAKSKEKKYKEKFINSDKKSNFY